VKDTPVLLIIPLETTLKYEADFAKPDSAVFKEIKKKLEEDLTPLLCTADINKKYAKCKCTVLRIRDSKATKRRRRAVGDPSIVDTELSISGGNKAAITADAKTATDAAKTQNLPKSGAKVEKVSDPKPPTEVGVTACTKNADCQGAGQECNENDKKCGCEPTDYVKKGTACEKKTVVGAKCPNVADCTGDNQKCSADPGTADTTCICKPTHKANADKKCTVTLVDAPCPKGTKEECTGANQECSTDKKCKCEKDFVPSDKEPSCVEDKLITLFSEIVFKDKSTLPADIPAEKTAIKSAIDPIICNDAVKKVSKGCKVEIGEPFIRNPLVFPLQPITATGKEADVLPLIKENMKNIPKTIGGSSAEAGPVSKSDFNKCTKDKPCEENEGDCDENTDCNQAKGLECGVNNCPAGSDPLADCCWDPKKDAETRKCDGQGTNMWTCCAGKKDGCKVDEGDCDDDKECEGDLVCGRNSCKFTIPPANKDRFFPAGQADCCISKARSLFYGIPTREDLVEDGFRNAEEPGFLNV